MFLSVPTIDGVSYRNLHGKYEEMKKYTRNSKSLKISAQKYSHSKLIQEICERRVVLWVRTNQNVSVVLLSKNFLFLICDVVLLGNFYLGWTQRKRSEETLFQIYEESVYKNYRNLQGVVHEGDEFSYHALLDIVSIISPLSNSCLRL